jgi:hypothetical protein
LLSARGETASAVKFGHTCGEYCSAARVTAPPSRAQTAIFLRDGVGIFRRPVANAKNREFPYFFAISRQEPRSR